MWLGVDLRIVTDKTHVGLHPQVSFYFNLSSRGVTSMSLVDANFGTSIFVSWSNLSYIDIFKLEEYESCPPSL